MLLKPEMSASLMGHLASMQTLPTFTMTKIWISRGMGGEWVQTQMGVSLLGYFLEQLIIFKVFLFYIMIINTWM